jgi:serine protease AprX
MAAIDWVVAHRNDDPKNPIRVLNLSYGLDCTNCSNSPVAVAVANAVKAGIMVVVAAGNTGKKITVPATSIEPIVVGSLDTMGTTNPADDTVSSFSSNDGRVISLDVLAPGRSIVSLRDPGSYADTNYASARVGTRYFKGSGTSQAAAVVSGGAALLLSQRPDLTPDQVKALLTRTTQKIPNTGTNLQGSGALDLAAAGAAATPTNATQHWRLSTGLGSLELARGSVHVSVNGRKVTGEVDVQGKAFNARAVARGLGAEASATARTRHSAQAQPGLSGVTWSGVTWSGVTWSGVTWSGVTWSGVTWSGVTWSGVTWSGVTWSGVTWSGTDWA